VKSWLLILFLLPAALAGGAEPDALPRLTLEAQTIGWTAELQTVPAVVYPDDGPYFQMFPAPTRAVLNPPGQRWKAQYDADQPPANAQMTRRALNSGQMRLNELR